jgi:predicted lipoprotein with Yx(FWY)xxD motif
MSTRNAPQFRTKHAGWAALAVAAGAAALSASPAGASLAPARQQSVQVISTRHIAGVGTVLVNRSGMTLYTPSVESHGRVHCTGSCLNFWFPVTTTTAAVSHSSKNIPHHTVSTLRRPDSHMMQATYKGKPLYTFRLDAAPGQARGNGVTDHFNGSSFTWHAVVVSGAHHSTTMPSTTSGAGSGGTSYGSNYGY